MNINNLLKLIIYVLTHVCFLESPTEVSLTPLGKPEDIKCDGKCGGSYLWKRHGFAIILPPDCADGTVNATIQAYLPISIKEHPFVSAVFGMATNVEEFKKPITLRFPHCVNVKSEDDKEKLSFLVLHNDSYKFKKGYFEIGESVGSIELTNFCKVCIFGYIISPFSSCFDSTICLVVSGLKCIIESLEKIKGEIDKRCLDLLILPKSHTEIRDWHGTYCIIWDVPTYLQVSS